MTRFDPLEPEIEYDDTPIPDALSRMGTVSQLTYKQDHTPMERRELAKKRPRSIGFASPSSLTKKKR